MRASFHEAGGFCLCRAARGDEASDAEVSQQRPRMPENPGIKAVKRSRAAKVLGTVLEVRSVSVNNVVGLWRKHLLQDPFCIMLTLAVFLGDMMMHPPAAKCACTRAMRRHGAGQAAANSQQPL